MVERLFDAHLDLAYLAELGRDMHAPLSDCKGSLLPAAVTLDALRRGQVKACLGTIFTEAIHTHDASTSDLPPYAYPADDPAAAWRAGMRQLKLYHAWRQAGVIELIEGHRTHIETTPAPYLKSPLKLGILMECADPIEQPDQLEEWARAGVIAIGLSWWHKSRYAGGNGSESGLTDLGKTLIARMDDLGIVHDLSHLSQRSTDELLDLTDKPVIASHSNCRALLGGLDNTDWQRHLSDETIKAIGKRGGVIGLNLVGNFIDHTLERAATERTSITRAIDHVEHICNLLGHAKSVGLGTDMDGGITANDLPEGINTPSDLTKLCDELAKRNFSDEAIEDFAWNNWARFWKLD